MNSLNNNESKENQFIINSQKENQLNHLKNNNKNKILVISYIAEENINRCWLFLSDVRRSVGVPSNIVKDYILNKGNNTYQIGNEFSGDWIGISKIHYKCVESQNNYCIRRIGWIINIDIGFSIRKIYYIYPIPNENKTLIKVNLEFITSENDEPLNFEETKDYYYKLQYTILNKIIKVMDTSSDYYFINESFIVKKNSIICWKNIINLQNLSVATLGEIGDNFVCNGDPEKVGNFWKCELKEEKKTIFIKIKKISKPKKKNTWKYYLETFGAQINSIKQECQINITKLNENTTQISFLIIYKEKINKKLYIIKKDNIKKVAVKIKSFLNNI